VKELYQRVLQEYIEKGYISEMGSVNRDEQQWILPHFPVVKRNQGEIKLRIVFDAAAQVQGRCLNDYLHTGPKLQSELLDVLLRMRKNRYVISCDIKEMYLQVEVCKDDRKFFVSYGKTIRTEY